MDRHAEFFANAAKMRLVLFKELGNIGLENEIARIDRKDLIVVEALGNGGEVANADVADLAVFDALVTTDAAGEQIGPLVVRQSVVQDVDVNRGEIDVRLQGNEPVLQQEGGAGPVRRGEDRMSLGHGWSEEFWVDSFWRSQTARNSMRLAAHP